jgi:hypothetical protein
VTLQDLSAERPRPPAQSHATTDQLADLLRRWQALSELDRSAFLTLALRAQESSTDTATNSRTHRNDTWRILAVQTLGAVRTRFLERDVRV